MADEPLDEVEDDEVYSLFEEADRKTGAVLDQDEEETDEDEDQTDEGEGSGDTEGSTAPPPVTNITIGERELPEDHVQNLLEFYDWARANPQAIAVFDAYLAGEVEMVQKGQKQEPEPEPEPEPDLEELISDPVLRREFENLRSWRREAEQQLQALNATREDEQRVQMQNAISDGTARFRDQYGLDDEQIRNLTAMVANGNVLGALVQQQGANADSVFSAFETAYWSTPEYREREVFRRMATDRQAKQRQRKAAALGGSSGSVPRTKDPKSPEERRAAMVADIRQAMEES